MKNLLYISFNWKIETSPNGCASFVSYRETLNSPWVYRRDLLAINCDAK